VAALAAAATAALVAGGPAAAAGVTVGPTVFTVQGLVGVGRIPAAARDAFGETFGSISGLLPDTAAWQRNGAGYSGAFWAMPDRGYNIAGTIDYQPRINRIAFDFVPAPLTGGGLAQNQIQLTLQTPVRLFESLPGGATLALSGLDPKPGGVAAGGARAATALLPELPQAHNGKLALDAEGVVRLADGSFLVSDEYGPSIYRFSAGGQFIGALPVAASVRPIRNGVTDYASNNPAAGQPAPLPANPTFGRQNNQGFEGISLSPDGRTLYVMLQSAARQDGGTGGNSATRDHTRLFTYDMSNLSAIALSGEYVVRLPRFTQTDGVRVAAQSEILALDNGQLLVLPRDSNGFAVGLQTSFYRRVDVVDVTGATNILGQPFEGTIAPGGVLNPAIVPAALHTWLDINDNAQLNRFGLNNGNAPGLDNLSEKWEGLALLPALDPAAPNDFFLFVANDNDFATTNGFQAGLDYADANDIDTMFLAYRVTMAPVPEPATALLMLAGVTLLAARRRPAASPAR
jgi:hypothetical protein